MRSTDNGVTWSGVVAAEANSWVSVAYNNVEDTWISVALNGTNRIMESFNAGITWKSVIAAEANQWSSVAYGNGVWVAVAATGTNRVMRSTNTSQNYTLTGTGTTSATFASMTYNNVFLGI